MPMNALSRVLVVTASALAINSHSSQPAHLLSYLQVGAHRIAFASDTFADSNGRIALVQSTMASASRALGPARRLTTGDAAGFLRTMCYRLAGPTKMVLVLESGEMGNGVWLTGFSLLPAGSRPDREHHCASLAVDPASIITNTGIRVGLTRPLVDQALALAGRDSAGVTTYWSIVPRTMTQKDGKTVTYDEGSDYDVRFEKNRVVGFAAGRIDSF